MQAHSPNAIQLPFEFNDLLDEEFDNVDIRQPFNRKPLREPATLLCDERSWDDDFDHSDMLCELQG